MHARMSTLEGPPDEMDEGLRDVKEHVLPLLQQQDGFKGFIALGDRQSGKLIGITFWESEQAMRDSEEVGDRVNVSAEAKVRAGVSSEPPACLCAVFSPYLAGDPRPISVGSRLLDHNDEPLGTMGLYEPS